MTLRLLRLQWEPGTSSSWKLSLGLVRRSSFLWFIMMGSHVSQATVALGVIMGLGNFKMGLEAPRVGLAEHLGVNSTEHVKERWEAVQKSQLA